MYHDHWSTAGGRDEGGLKVQSFGWRQAHEKGGMYSTVQHNKQPWEGRVDGN